MLQVLFRQGCSLVLRLQKWNIQFLMAWAHVLHRMAVLVEVDDVEVRITVVDKEVVDKASVVHLTDVQAEAVNAARLTIAADKEEEDRASVARHMNVQVVEASVVHHTNVLAVVANVAHHTNVLEVAVNVVHHIAVEAVDTMQNYYKLPKEVKVYIRNEKYIFINPLLPTWFVTNELGKYSMELYDGTNSVEDVVAVLTEVLGNEEEKRIRQFCESVISSGIFNTEPRQQPMRDKSLKCVHLSLSSGCNLKCKYCYAAERKESSEQNLCLDDYKAIVDDLGELSEHITYTITGGEPLLNPLWEDIARYIKSKGNTLFLLTNGTLINDSNIRIIKNLFDLVTISIDGPTKESHALTRGDNFERVVDAIELLEKYEVNYTLSMTVTRLNIEQVEPMAKRWGARLNYAPLFPVSDYADDELSITGDEYYQALTGAFGVNPLSYCESSLDVSRWIQNHKCAIGDNEISISATGDVYPCQLLHSKHFFAGNIHNNSVIEIYNNSDVLRECAKLDVDNIEKCKDCAIRYICGGACRARGYYETGDVRKSGDFCNYEFMAFLDGISKIYSANVL